MCRAAILILVSLTAAAMALPAARASALTPSAPRCGRAIAVAGAQLFKRSAVLLAACQRRVARGLLAPGTDCLAATQAVREIVAAGVARRLRLECPDAVSATLGLGGDCTDARSADAVVGCIAGSHAAAAAALLEITNGTAQSAAAGRCQMRALLEAGGLAFARVRSLQHCKLHPPADLLPGVDCSPDTRVRDRRSAAIERIVGDCPSAALAAARFGPPCAAPANADALAGCVLSAAERAADAMVDAQFPDRGFCGDSPQVEPRIDALLAQMTQDEKLEQMHGRTLNIIWLTPGVERLGLPGLGMIDGPRGVSALAGKATAFPVGMARGATWDLALEERVGDVIGTEARAKGASVILAPVLNLLRHPRWGRAQETYGEDTFHLGRMGVAFIGGAQRHVLASAKHFAANSIEDTRFNVSVQIDERSLREIYLPHFRAAVQEAHTASVMSAYNRVNGQYCAENFHLLHDILKGDWGFDGFVESDWLLGTRSTVASALAGLDMEMPWAAFYGQPLADAVASGAVPQAIIDGAVRRIVRAQLCFRLDTDPPRIDPSLVETAAHSALALEVARKAIVLLKNDQAALPLDRSQLQAIAVVGDLAAVVNLGDGGSSSVVPSAAVTPLDGIRAGAGALTVTHVPSVTLSPSDEATIAAADAAVVVAGLTAIDEGELVGTGGDRESLVLPRAQDDLIAAVAALNPRTIVVLEGSGPVTMPWVDSVAAVVMAWYPGQRGGDAIADVLFGDVNPSGKLPLSFPRAESDLPPFDNQSLEVTYDYFHGYRYLDRNGVAALFPFGFGLSYTTFAYANLAVTPATLSPYDHLRVTADVTNTGAVAGDEVAQLYVGYTGSRVDRAVHDLKGFARVHLEPGETTTVAFDVRAQDLAFWDTLAAAWEVEPITYTVHVGSSSRDLPLTGSFIIQQSAM